MSPRPFLKWAGGKRKIVKDIIAILREDSEENSRQWFPVSNQYVEPFFGGGALFFHLVREGIIKPEDARISDLEPSLINVLRVLKHPKRRQRLIRGLAVLENEYHEFQAVHDVVADNSKSRYDRMYYLRRDDLRKFQRKQPTKISEQIEWASLMIFLNRTGFNGLWRVNSNGEYNVPEGRYKKPKICDESLLDRVGPILEKVAEISSESYKDAMARVKKGDLIYLDPPYFPLYKGQYVFKDYTEEGFDDEQQEELAEAAAKAVSNGAMVIASNNYLCPTIEILYQNASNKFGIPPPVFKPVKITRTMSSIGEDRIEKTEVLILMHPDHPKE